MQKALTLGHFTYMSHLQHQAHNNNLLPHPGRGTEYCHQPVCLCVCLSVYEHISGTAGPTDTKFCVQIVYGRGSILLWQRCATLYTSGLWMTSHLAVMGHMSMHVAKYSIPRGVVRPGQILMSMNALLKVNTRSSSQITPRETA